MLATIDIWDKALAAPQRELAHHISDRILLECSYLFLRRLWAKVTRDLSSRRQKTGLALFFSFQGLASSRLARCDSQIARNTLQSQISSRHTFAPAFGLST